MDQPTTEALLVFCSAFLVAAFSGLATALRFSRSLGAVIVVSAMLNSGLLGLAVALYWYNKFLAQGNIYGLVAVCIMVGLGGGSLTDFVLYLLRKGGLNVTIETSEASLRRRRGRKR